MTDKKSILDGYPIKEEGFRGSLVEIESETPSFTGECPCCGAKLTLTPKKGFKARRKFEETIETK